MFALSARISFTFNMLNIRAYQCFSFAQRDVSGFVIDKPNAGLVYTQS